MKFQYTIWGAKVMYKPPPLSYYERNEDSHQGQDKTIVIITKDMKKVSTSSVVTLSQDPLSKMSDVGASGLILTSKIKNYSLSSLSLSIAGMSETISTWLRESNGAKKVNIGG